MIGIRREQLRLNRVFQRLLLLSLAAPGGVYACSSSSGSNAPGTEDGGTTRDATAGGDGQVDGHVDSDSGQPGVDAGAKDSAPSDAGGDTANPACNPSAPYYNDASLVPPKPDSGVVTDRTCYYFVDLPCPANYTVSGCYLYLKDCATVCNGDGGFVDCRYWDNEGCSDASVVAEAGQPITIACGLCSGVGRRPEGLDEPCFAPSTSALGDYLARAAHLEAASVDAFLALGDELSALGAPRELVQMATRSAKDEVRHARVTGRLARQHGGAVIAPRVRRPARRSLEAIARENAVEGCVRETFGAMVATWQAAHASDPKLRVAMRRIAADERRHAALAWAVATWADTRLDAAARGRIRAARSRAVRSLATDVSRDNAPSSLLQAAGLPTPSRARALVHAMAETLWT